MPNHFASGIVEVALKAVGEDKSAPHTKEEETTSFLFPADSPLWQDVAPTFAEGRLSLNCIPEQFNEDLPKLTEALVKAELEARARLTRTLHSLTASDTATFVYPGLGILRVLSKSMTAALRYDLNDFAIARKACREHVLKEAQIRHEINRLINSSIWGVN